MSSATDELPLCGVWVDDHGHARVSLALPDGGRTEAVTEFRPFAWLQHRPRGAHPLVEFTALAGPGPFRWLARAATSAAYDGLLEELGRDAPVDALRSLESQFLLQRRRRLFEGMRFGQLRRCQLDIETATAGGDHFSDPRNPGDRVLAIGLRCGGCDRLLTLERDDDAAERVLLEALNAALEELDPDTLEGHNLFRFDLDFLRQRARRLKVACAWGRFGQRAVFRPARLKLAERWFEFPRCDVPGRAVVDTLLLVQLYDLGARELPSYGLKDVAEHLGLSPAGRTLLPGAAIEAAFRGDRPLFEAYLRDDLRETAALADLLLPTYFEQARTFPATLQEVVLRGTAAKIDLLMLERYYHAAAAVPAPAEVAPFEGGFTRSFAEGVFRHVLHFDVASLYPSLLLLIGRSPRQDSLGVFIPLLRELRDYRLRYKALARTAETAELRAEAQARQAAFKVLINSFYGYLGFSGARFGDGELAAEVTRRGRELLQALIERFAREDCRILEADTDGIYLSSPRWFDRPEELLARAAAELPPGIDLEFDGAWQAMFCYKAKNYALFDGERVIVRGSALRSRGVEPFLRRLTEALVAHLLGAPGEDPLALLEHYRAAIAARTLPVAELARSETLSQSPEAYTRAMAEGGKPRRAAAEAALLLPGRLRPGDRVSYYLGPRERGRAADWQRARPVELHDPETAPYDPAHYLAKLDDWIERYGAHLGVRRSPDQGELPL